VGGGPGRYAFKLADLGHRVTLADLAANNVAFARKKAEELGLELDGYVQADARHLPFLDDAFDVVLALGPLYHLTAEADRARAVTECLRVLRPGGLVAFAFISLFAPFYDMVVPRPEVLPDWWARVRAGHLRDGIHHPRSENPQFTDAWFVDPFQIEAFFNPYGVDKLALVGVEGMTAQSKYQLYQLPADLLAVWMDFVEETATSPAALAGSEHLVYFGRKHSPAR
jgi:S-adenosylmethionine-dependent methyltransferase